MDSIVECDSADPGSTPGAPAKLGGIIMKEEKENKKIKNNEEINLQWFEDNGYKSPEDLINYDTDLDKPKEFFGIFTAYNQHNIAEKKPWNKWPEWEFCLTSMKDSLHFEDLENDKPQVIAEREHWLALAQMIYENDDISIDDYTISINGRNGNKFAFDFCLENNCWGTPGTFAEHKSRMESSKVKLNPNVRKRDLYAFEHQIGHSLGPWWTCPEYIPNHGGKRTIHTPDSSFCVTGIGDTFPSTMLSAIHLCIDDFQIWIIQYEEAESTAEYIQRIEREYPSGRPEDYFYM
tara:strand:- start:222 stop:1097 length:876 start_codon:yes stop_codon:yes gene_type:complete